MVVLIKTLCTLCLSLLLINELISFWIHGCSYKETLYTLCLSLLLINKILSFWIHGCSLLLLFIVNLQEAMRAHSPK